MAARGLFAPQNKLFQDKGGAKKKTGAQGIVADSLFGKRAAIVFAAAVFFSVGVGCLVLFFGNYITDSKTTPTDIRDPSGNAAPLKVDADGNLLTETSVSVSVGDIAVQESSEQRSLAFSVFANATGSTSYELLDVQTQSFPTSAAVVTIEFDNTVDGPSTNGAHSVLVTGLDANWRQASEVITFPASGTTVSGTTSFSRVLKAEVVSVGLYHGTNAAQIDIKRGSDVLFSIEENTGQRTAGITSIPEGYDAYIRSMEINVVANNGYTGYPLKISIMYLPDADETSLPQAARHLYTAQAGEGNLYRSFESYIGPISERSDVWLMSTNTNPEELTITTRVEYIIVDNQ